MKLIPSKYDRTGRILDWTVKYLKWPEDVETGVQERLTAALKKTLLAYDCNTYCADGRWFWRDRNPSDGHFDGVVWPLIFKKEYFGPTEYRFIGLFGSSAGKKKVTKSDQIW